LITRLQAAFSEVLGKPVVSHQSLKSAFRELGPDKGNSEIILDPEILNQVMVPRLDEHYRHTLETSIPMLKDKTPREAVKTKEGRKRVIQWLLFIESNHNQSKTMPAYSFDWLWDELGLSRLEVSR
jgi:hypothetical protein